MMVLQEQINVWKGEINMFKWSDYPIEFLQMVLVKETANDEAAKKRLEFYWDKKEVLSGMLSYIYPKPNYDFITRYRALIEQELFVQNEEVLRELCRAAGIKGRKLNERYSALFTKPMSETLIEKYQTAMDSIAARRITYDENSKFKHTIPIDMKITPYEDVPLYDFQKEAVEKLKTHFEKNNAGMLIMPTGSGKTRTADYFVIHDMISQGYQVIWLCHRHMLIDQAATGFYNFAGLAKELNPKIKKYSISCISNEHLKVSSVGKDTVIVASNMSLNDKFDYLSSNMLGKKIMLVVDECHHSTAPTFKRIIKYVRKHRKNTKLLGLTATPVRMGEKDTRELFSIYDDSIIHTVKMSDLIARGTLAFPVPKRIKTKESFEAYIDMDDEKYIKKYGEISPRLADRMAKSNSRNKIIVKEYLENKDKYGKTLIFAINQIHCRLLKEEFVKAGINCDDIYSGKENNSEVISRFKDNKIDVLININILTEGSDVPDIQTVFLCRPTQSEGLLLQCIGRGMRGVEAHGTEKLYVVDFYDQWETFNKWLNPVFFIEGELSGETEKIMETVRVETVQYEWNLIQELYAHMVSGAYKIGEYVSIPSAWMSIPNDDGSETRILVFENQLSAYKKFFADMKLWMNTTDMQYLLDKYFSGDIDRPSCDELRMIVDYVSANGYKPEFHSIINRKQIEPLEVIRRAKEEGVDYIELATRMYQSNSTARDVFDTLDKYLDQVRYAKESKGFNLPRGSKVEELPFEFVPFDKTPYYDIQKLYAQVLSERPEVSKYSNVDINWSDVPYADAFGRNFGDGRVRINCILNSKDVPEEVIKFLIYHELLHEEHRNHGKIFRELEHRYPGYEKWDYFLDGKFPYFQLREED